MDKHTNEYEDQAAELRKLVNEVQEETAAMLELAKTESETDDDIDILNLPPRKEVHSKNKTRAQMKISRPMIRLIVVIILAIAVLAGVYYGWKLDMIELP